MLKMSTEARLRNPWAEQGSQVHEEVAGTDGDQIFRVLAIRRRQTLLSRPELLKLDQRGQTQTSLPCSSHIQALWGWTLRSAYSVSSRWFSGMFKFRLALSSMKPAEN